MPVYRTMQIPRRRKLNRDSKTYFRRWRLISTLGLASMETGRERERDGKKERVRGFTYSGHRLSNFQANGIPLHLRLPFFCPSIIRNYEFWSNGQRCIWKVNASRGIYNFAISPVASEERVEELYIKMRSIFEGDFVVRFRNNKVGL